MPSRSLYSSSRDSAGHVLAVDLDRAGIGAHLPGDVLEQGGLAGAAGAHDRGDLAARNIHVQLVEDGLSVEHRGQATDAHQDGVVRRGANGVGHGRSKAVGEADKVAEAAVRRPCDAVAPVHSAVRRQQLGDQRFVALPLQGAAQAHRPHDRLQVGQRLRRTHR